MRTSEGQVCNGLYEEGPLRDVTGLTVRPGGLALTERALEVCSFAAGAQLLDVGCGAGATVEHLHSSYGFAARGLDSSRKLITEGLNRNPALSLEVAAAEVLPFAEESQDGILCECVLSLLEEPSNAVKEFQRVLRSGGYLVLSDMYNRNMGPECSLRGMVTRGQVESWLAGIGFAIILWEDHTVLLRELAARLMLVYGSLEGLCNMTDNVGKLPGYYLLVARKA